MKKDDGHPSPFSISVDWAPGQGMLRGEIIKKTGNVIEVRFKTAGFSFSFKPKQG